MIAKRNTKKGSALITTVMVALLVCALVGTMLSLALWDKNLAKTAEKEVTKQNQLDMLTDVFLKYGVKPENTFGYSIEVFYFEDGSSTMTVRAKETSPLCTMLVSQHNGEIIERYYDVPYEHTETVCNRTIGIHNETDAKPYLKLSVPKSEVSANGPFYVYGRIKLERAVGIGSNPVRAFVNMGINGSGDKTVMTLTANTDGWANLHNEDGSPLKFDSVPSKSLDFLFGMDNTSGELAVADLVIVNSKNIVCYSLANDPYINGIGNVPSIQGSYHWWEACGRNSKNTTYPIVTRSDNYVPKRMISIHQDNDKNAGEACVALYKSALRDAKGTGEGWYYLTGRVRINVTGYTELCEKVAGEWPTGMLLDISGDYDHDNNEATPEVGPYVSADKLQAGVFHYKSGCWSPILTQDANYFKFYISNNCERSGEDYIKFTLWAAKGTYDIADIRVYKMNGSTPNPDSDTPVYNMETDDSVTKNTSMPNCALGGETKINDFWSIHWLPHKTYIQNGTIGTSGSWTVQTAANPKDISHNKVTDYSLPVFPNKKGDTYDPKK